MPESNKPFVINDRRRFTNDGEPRPDAEIVSEPTPILKPVATSEPAQPPVQQEAEPEDREEAADQGVPAPPTVEQMEQSRIAFEATAERIEIAIRAANPGIQRPPAMSFVQIVQSVYMQAVLQLGGGTQEGQQPQVDLLGARQSIDMLTVLAEKTKGNLSPDETVLIESAIFELRLAFLEITQVLARSAAARTSTGNPRQVPGAPAGPSIVR